MRVVIPLFLAVLLGVGAIFVGQRYLEQKGQAALPRQELARVVVAQEDLAAGEMIEPKHLRLVEMAPDAVPRTAFSKRDELVGRVVSMQVIQGQTLLEGMLAPEGTGRGLQALVPPGMRAVAIQVNETTSVGGWLVPGARVDVIGTYHDDVTNEMVAKTVVQNVEVTRVGQRMESSDRQGVERGEVTRSVTLLVTPEQAEMLELASYRGRPRLVLRGGADEETVRSSGVSYAQLLGVHGETARRLQALEAELAAAMARASAAEAEANTLAARRSEPSPAQPAVETPSPIQRTVHIIRGGRESQVNFHTLPDGQMEVTEQGEDQPAQPPTPAASGQGSDRYNYIQENRFQ